MEFLYRRVGREPVPLDRTGDLVGRRDQESCRLLGGRFQASWAACPHRPEAGAGRDEGTRKTASAPSFPRGHHCRLAHAAPARQEHLCIAVEESPGAHGRARRPDLRVRHRSLVQHARPRPARARLIRVSERRRSTTSPIAAVTVGAVARSRLIAKSARASRARCVRVRARGSASGR